jgi:hypothetical protein
MLVAAAKCEGVQIQFCCIFRADNLRGWVLPLLPVPAAIESSAMLRFMAAFNETGFVE